jgi:hypothetical protein
VDREPKFHPPTLRLSAVLAHLVDPAAPGAAPPALTLGEILDRTAHAGFGFLLVFLALVGVPFVGLSTPFGLAVAFLGAQMLGGKLRPWLPGFLRRRVVPPRAIAWLAGKVAHFTARLERLVKPRYPWLTRGPLIGLGLTIQGLGLALPLPIPGSNWIFIGPILVYAIGLLEDDGAWVAVAHLCHLVQGVLGFLFWHAVRAGVERVITWF